MIDKRNQQLQCPYCEKVYTQKQRYDVHIAKQHAEEHAAAQEDEASTSQEPQTNSKVMQVGSKAGYFTKKSPHLFLVEQCQSEKRIKPKIKVLVRFYQFNSVLSDVRSYVYVSPCGTKSRATRYCSSWKYLLSLFGVCVGDLGASTIVAGFHTVQTRYH